MQVFAEISSWFKSWSGEARMPQVEASTANQTYTPEQLEAFIKRSSDTEQKAGESLLLAQDLPNIFSRCDVHSSWRIAESNLVAFRGQLERSGHTGTCLWFEGSEAPQAILLGELLLDCSANRCGEQLEIHIGQTKVGDARAILGWVGPSIKVIGWIAMIDTDKLQ
jgi:hypothetical protein